MNELVKRHWGLAVAVAGAGRTRSSPSTVAKTATDYVNEFEGRHNVRPLDTANQMATMAARTVGKHLPYEALIGPEHTRMIGGAIG